MAVDCCSVHADGSKLAHVGFYKSINRILRYNVTQYSPNLWLRPPLVMIMIMIMMMMMMTMTMTMTMTTMMIIHCWHRNQGAIINNYSPKWRWLAVDIYRAAERRGKYPTLATDTEVNSCFSIY